MLNLIEKYNKLLECYKIYTEENIPNIPGIYLFKNKINNKIYIGQSINIRDRYKKHWANITDGNYFHNALKKYGKDNFDFYILEIIEDKETQNDREIYYISKFNSDSLGYNLTKGGLGHLGTIPSKETLQAIAEKNSRYCIAYNFISKSYIEANSRIELSNKLQSDGYTECNVQKIYDTIANNSSYTGDYLIANTLEELKIKINTFEIPKQVTIYLYNYIKQDDIKVFNTVVEAEQYIKDCGYMICSGHVSTAMEKNNNYIKDFLFGTSLTEINSKIETFSPYVYFYNIEDRYIMSFKNVSRAVEYFKSINISCNITGFSKAKSGEQKKSSGFIVGRTPKELIERICKNTANNISDTLLLIKDYKCENEQFVINWADLINKLSIEL